MYQVDDLDQVIELHTIPQSSVGSPTPLILANEGRTVVAYYMQDDADGEKVALVKFQTCHAQMFGPPNDEAFHGHPLASRGLHSYSFFQIENSSWLRLLEKMNSFHYRHSHHLFEKYKHYILSFHDSTFECIAENYEYSILSEPHLDLLETTMFQKLKQ